MRLIGRERTLVMGILNATDDSFAGDGLANDTEALRARGLQMVIDGADALDVGAASSRPGHGVVPLETEYDRADRAVAALAERVAVPISIDSARPEVVERCLARGASVVNDVSTLADERLAALAAGFDAELIIAHAAASRRSRRERDTTPGAVVEEVRHALADACARAEHAGLARGRILVDPGLGFSKTPAESFVLLRELRVLRDLGPLLVGPSRKGHLGAATGRPVDERVFATAAAVAAAIAGGADVVRVHDVAEMADVARVSDAIRRGVGSGAPSRVVFVGLGANLGDRRQTMRRAVAELARVGEVVAVSGLWSTAPQLVTDQPPFLNAVAALRIAPRPAGEILRELQAIERQLGRTAGSRYGPRMIDLDLLLFSRSGEVETDGDVVVPHPRLAERRFVLEPLCELAPRERDPRDGHPVGELLPRVADQIADIAEGGAWWKTASS